MKTYGISITGVSDFMYGKAHDTEKQSNETHEQFEQRTWQEKIHHVDGHCFIQPFALKNALESAGKWLAMKIKGEGKKTFTLRFMAGTLVVDRMMLMNSKGKPVTIDDVEPLKLFVPSDGKRNSPKRVWRIFPTVHDWKTTAILHVLDDKIDLKVLEAHMKAVGQFIGFGAMRVEKGGINGRFNVDSIVEVKAEKAA